MTNRIKLDGRISIFINREYTTIEIEDDKANTKFVNIKLTPEQFCAALSRQMSVECELTVSGLEKVGKVHENSTFEFEIPKELRSSDYSKELQELAQSQLTDGWVAMDYFRSQGSFFNRGDKHFARCTIRRWLSSEQEPERSVATKLNHGTEP